MNNKYLTILEQELNEVTIHKTSELRKKFVSLVKDKFSDNGGFLVMEAGDKKYKITQDDLQNFHRYKLLAKNNKGIRVTNKGIACAMGVEVGSNEDDTKYTVNFLKTKFKDLFPPKAPEKDFMKWIIATQKELKSIKV